MVAFSTIISYNKMHNLEFIMAMGDSFGAFLLPWSMPTIFGGT